MRTPEVTDMRPSTPTINEGGLDADDFGVERWRDIPCAPQKFGSHYDVYGGLLPFQYLVTDRFERFRRTAEFIEGLPDTRVGFTLGQLAEAIEMRTQQFGNNPDFELFLLVHGAHKLDQSMGRQDRYFNPSYVHGPPRTVTDPDERAWWLYQYALAGVHPAAELAEMFGVEDGAMVTQFARRYGISWTEMRDRGRCTFARTLYLAREWTGCSQYELAAMFGVARTTVADYLERAGEDFGVVPPDPSGWKSYARSEGRNRHPQASE